MTKPREIQEVEHMNLNIDEKFFDYFKNLKQVFLYLTDNCNLNCLQCLYKPDLVMKKRLEVALAKELLYNMRKLGAYKLSFLGGEVTTYPTDEAMSIFAYAKEIGYSYTRIDTNGHFDHALFSKGFFSSLDEVSVSIDGYDVETNDGVRGDGLFEIACESLDKLVSTVKNVHISCCVTKQASIRAGGIMPLVEKMIFFAKERGVKSINFHGVFCMGVPMDAWTASAHLDPEEWYNVSETILSSIRQKKYCIPVRFPVRIVKKEEFENHKEFYGYCPSKLGERVLIHPSGIIRICSSLLSTCYGVATYDRNGIYWNSINNELDLEGMDRTNNELPCAHQKKLYDDDKGYVPVCFSLKPYQKEVVWQDLVQQGIIKEVPYE